MNRLKLSQVSLGVILAFALFGGAACGKNIDPTSAPDSPKPTLVNSATASIKPTPTLPPPGSPLASESGIVRGIPVPTQHFGLAVASLEERTFLSDSVVKARFVSAGENILRFRAITYMKGTGPTKFSVKANTDGRDTQWDNQDAILFLKPLDDGTADFTFTDTTTWDYTPTDFPNIPDHFRQPVATDYRGTLPEGYTLGANNPVWLPVTGSSDGSSSSTRSTAQVQPEIIVEYDILTGAPNSVSQTTLQEVISWISGVSGAFSGGGAVGKSQVAGGSSQQWWNDEDYRNCIRRSMMYYRSIRDLTAHGVLPREPSVHSDYIESGVGAGVKILDLPDERISFPETAPAYDTYTIEGPNAHLFNSQIIDDDGEVTTGWDYSLTTARPLPAGVYEHDFNYYPFTYQPCNFVPPSDSHITTQLVVTAPPGTVHEAFFDPATTTAGVGYLAGSATTTGVLEPAGFSMRGRDIDITGLEWRNGQVVLSFDRTVQLSDGLSFIETDGTAGLYLSQFDATEDLRARTVTWDVSEQPWESGDELMLRIGPIPLPGVRNLTAERGSGREVVLRWEVEYTAGVNGYRIWRHQPGRDEGPRIYVSDTLSTDTTYTDANSPVPNLTEYRVQAIDRIYNAGESSESVRVGSE